MKCYGRARPGHLAYVGNAVPTPTEITGTRRWRAGPVMTEEDYSTPFSL